MSVPSEYEEDIALEDGFLPVAGVKNFRHAALIDRAAAEVGILI